jgi:hypothetical protein
VLPILDAASNEYGTPSQGNPVTYVDTPTIDASAAQEGQAVTVADTLPSGVTPTSGGGEAASSTTAAFGTNPATAVSCTSTLCTATSPGQGDGAADVDVTVTTPGGTSATGSADQFSYEGAPSVTAVSPAAGPYAGGTTVTITGTGFDAIPTTAVDFAGTSATTFTVHSGTSITATSPAEPAGVSSAGVADITVTNETGPSATSSADQFSYDAVPTVSAVAPAVGTTNGGDVVTITGTGFVVGSTTAAFGTNPATAVSCTSTLCTATSPGQGDGAADVDVTVTTPGGTSATGSADQFSYEGAPSVTAVSPAAGPYAGGTTVIISGTPTTAGSYSAVVTATDNLGASGSAGFTWAITAPAPAPAPVSSNSASPVSSSKVTVANPGAQSDGLGAAIAPQVNTATSTPPGASFTWSATGLPAGLAIGSATGTITGTPTTAGTYTVSISATDSSGSGTASFAWTITQARLSITPSSLASPAVGTAYAMTLAAVGGTAPYSWSLSSGSLPAGLALDGSTGAISGTPSLAGASTFSLTVTDSTGQKGTQSYTLAVLAASAGTAPPAHAGIMASVPGGTGYWVASSNGTVLAFGSAQLYGSTAKLHLLKPSWV